MLMGFITMAILCISIQIDTLGLLRWNCRYVFYFHFTILLDTLPAANTNINRKA